MAARPRNNLHEHDRQIGGTPTPPARVMPASPLAIGSKQCPQSKFKVSKSITSSTPSNVTVRSLPTFSTPGFNKATAPVATAISPSVADASNLSIISVSSTDSAPPNASNSSVPAKRVSSGSPADLLPTFSPKRQRTDHILNKENRCPIDTFDKGKGRARDLTQERDHRSTVTSLSTSLTVQPRVQTPPSHNAQCTLPATALHAALGTLPHDAGLEEMSEEELRGVCSTSDSLLEWCNKQIGAARADAGDPRDVVFCNILADFAEKRLASARTLLRGLQRGERQPTCRHNPSTLSTSFTVTSSGRPNGALNGALNPWDEVNHSATLRQNHPSAAFDSGPSRPNGSTANGFDDDDYWGSDDAFFEGLDPIPPAAPPRANSPADQLRPSPLAKDVLYPSSSGSEVPLSDPPHNKELEKRTYYPRLIQTLKNVFRLQSFRPLQLEAICDAMEGLDVFVLFPTGSGKSLTFQLPAVCQDGVTVVVSPLISLIRDQHRALKGLGVDAEILVQEMSESDRSDLWRRLRGNGKPPSLLYITPERLELDGMRSVLTRLRQEGKLCRFVIDEAHLITDWGRSFRDSYVQLKTLKTVFPGVPISALTGTANPTVQSDIVSRLRLVIRQPYKLSHNRPNLDYDVRYKGKNVLGAIADWIKSTYPRDTGIIYCSSRDKCEEIAKILRDKFQLSARHYHAQMADTDKSHVQREWSSGKVRIIVATVAFGMGIDKPDVRYVIHHSLPNSLNGYYQETGRAGRDGKLAHCILYYNRPDFHTRLSMIRNQPSKENRTFEEDDIRRVMSYVMNDVECRRKQVLSFFCEDFDPARCRRMCNNCRDATPCVTEDHTGDAQRALRLFENLSRDSRLTPTQLSAALKGSKAQLQVERGWTNDPLHGTCSHLSQDVIDRLIDQMIWHDFLSIRTERSQDAYSQNYLALGSRANALRTGQQNLTISFRAGRKGTARAQQKPDSRAAHDVAPDEGPSTVPLRSIPSAVPSRRGASAGPSSSSGPPSSVSVRSRKKTAPAPVRRSPLAEQVDHELSLWRDDPEGDPDFIDDEIEDISSPPPPRRVGTRGMPSASQTIADGYVSEIEDEPAPYRVTMIRPEDLDVAAEVNEGGEEVDVAMRCRADLLELRDQVRGAYTAGIL
ncbi:hypothetical protein BN946_scf185042.g25 [Trametes cinnabarina]|uniref:DNA 3'-5' helicase n=1 Tax=Pycnoporus cinnabarinus TaxID=5643 RepID=A0A060S9Q6_PYCCI|nr:hypothetical protein BN946_scf185042.g25 [Trametes cinnabarina]